MSQNPIKLSLEAARQIAIKCQLLNKKPNLPGGKKGIAQTIEKLGYIQIDTIAVIERAHHHTLWTRCPDYSNEMLHNLQVQDRRVFEYWGHQASYLPMSDYRFYLPRMKSFHDPDHYWFKDRHERAKHLLEPVLQRIRKEGPLSSRDFKPPADAKRGTWWDWQPAKIALELLYWRGDLMITERRNFQKVYDLTERVLPKDVDTTFPSDEELGRFMVTRALNSMGVAREKDILNHLEGASKNLISNALKEMAATGEVQIVKLENEANFRYFALPKNLEESTIDSNQNSEVHLLSPFDNLVIHRDRTRRIFDFDYTIECYVPAPKRKYGYFSLPILWKTQFAGRLDPAADRKNKTMQIKNLVFEPDFNMTEEFQQAFISKLKDFTRFNNCEKIIFENNALKNKGYFLQKIQVD